MVLPLLVSDAVLAGLANAGHSIVHIANADDLGFVFAFLTIASKRTWPNVCGPGWT